MAEVNERLDRLEKFLEANAEQSAKEFAEIRKLQMQNEFQWARWRTEAKEELKAMREQSATAQLAHDKAQLEHDKARLEHDKARLEHAEDMREIRRILKHYAGLLSIFGEGQANTEGLIEQTSQVFSKRKKVIIK